MALSPQRIRDANFKTARKGYDAAEVESFLEEVAAALETAQNEATAMEAKARAAVARLQELSRQSTEGAPDAGAADGAAVRTHVDESETISRTLLLAQRTADTTVAEARDEADRLLASARDDAARSLDEARAEVAELLEAARSDARRAGESERVEVEGEVQALLARRDFLESDVDHLEQYLLAQRERIVEAVASLSDLVQRVPGGLAAMRRPLLSAAADPEPEAGQGNEPEPVPDPGLDVDQLGAGGLGASETDEPSAPGADDGDEIAEITRVASADDRPTDSTPASGTRFEEDGEPTRQIVVTDPRDPARD